MSIGKTQLITDVADVTSLPPKEVAKALESLLDTISQYAGAGQKVIIQGFGTFEMKHKAARMGRNPATGLPVEIAAKSVLSFRPAKTKA
jgi:DNA-binding protein HU-beta